MSLEPHDGKTLRPATTVVASGRPAREPDNPLNEPLTMASTYVAGGDVEYGRYGNPGAENHHFARPNAGRAAEKYAAPAVLRL